MENIFGSLAEHLPHSTDGNESFTFTMENLPILTLTLETQNLYIKRSQHTYNDSCRYDSLNFNAHKETYRFLGLLILSAVFHSQPSNILVRLNHPESDITNLSIESPHLVFPNIPSGYHTKPFAFKYYPAISWKHPFDKCANPENLPCFSLAYMNAFPHTDEEWNKRDTMKIFGRDTGMVLFAELLLNAALPQNDEDEYELEGEGGFRGVGINSAEVRMFLPGHLAWFDEHWQ